MTARTNCRAKMRLKRENDGTLVVKEIVWEHNHRLQLTPKCLSSCTPTKTLTKQSWSTSSTCSSKAFEHVQIMSILGGDDPVATSLK